MVTWETLHERLRYGFKKFGFDSDFKREYSSMCAQLRFNELDEFFSNWEIPQRCYVVQSGAWIMK